MTAKWKKGWEIILGERRVTTGWENPASPNIYSCLYKPQLAL
jgi:hypothetical protein